MNQVGAGLASGALKAAITADLRGLLVLGAVPTSVTVETPTAESYDVAAGTVSPTTDDDALTAYKAPLSVRDVEIDPSARRGDVWWYVPSGSVSSVPTPASSLLAGSTRYAVLSVDTDPLGAFYRLHTRVRS